MLTNSIAHTSIIDNKSLRLYQRIFEHTLFLFVSYPVELENIGVVIFICLFKKIQLLYVQQIYGHV